MNSNGSSSQWGQGWLLTLQSQGEMEVTVMAKDDRDILELLKEELAFVEQGRIWTLSANAVVAEVGFPGLPDLY